MKTFTVNKVIRRAIAIKSCDRAISDSTWVLDMGLAGVSMRRYGEQASSRYHLSWRSIISHALIHNARKGSANVGAR